MLLRLEFVLLHFIPQLLSEIKIIKKILGVASTGAMALKKFGRAIFTIPLRILITVFRFQLRIIYFPFRLVNNLYQMIFQQNKSAQNCDKSIQATSEPVQETACEKSVQANSDSAAEICDRIYNAVSISTQTQSKSPVEISDTNQKSNISDSAKDKSTNSIKDASLDGMICSTTADYMKYSELVKGKTLKLVDELRCVINRIPCGSIENEANLGGLNLFNDKMVQTTSDLRNESTEVNENEKVDKIIQDIKAFRNNPCKDAYHLSQENDVQYKLGRKRTLELIDELSNLTKYFQFNEEAGKSTFSRPNKSKLYSDKPREFNTECNSEDSYHKLFKSADCVESANGVACAIRSLKKIQHKKERLNYEYNSVAKGILTQTVPAIKQVFKVISPHKESYADKRSVFENSKPIENNNFFHNISKLEALDDNKVQQINGHQILNLSIEVMHSLVDMITQEVVLLKRKLATANHKMEEVLKSSESLFDELSKINERFSKLITLSTKITNLQRELGEDHKNLKEIEADRNEMHLKLLTLEKLIKEEEEYLDDVSIESGYEEFENRATSPYNKNDDL